MGFCVGFEMNEDGMGEGFDRCLGKYGRRVSQDEFRLSPKCCMDHTNNILIYSWFLLSLDLSSSSLLSFLLS